MEILKVGRLAVVMVVVGLALTACEPKDKKYATETKAEENRHEIEKLEKNLASAERIAAATAAEETLRLFNAENSQTERDQVAAGLAIQKLDKTLEAKRVLQEAENALRLKQKEQIFAAEQAALRETYNFWEPHLPMIFTLIMLTVTILCALSAGWRYMEKETEKYHVDAKNVAQKNRDEARNETLKIFMESLHRFPPNQQIKLLDVYLGKNDTNPEQWSNPEQLGAPESNGNGNKTPEVTA